MYRAVSDACYVYQYLDLEHNLRRFGWRQARKRVLQHGALSGEWVNRGRGELRLRRREIEVRLDDGRKRLIGWKELRSSSEPSVTEAAELYPIYAIAVSYG